MSISAAPPTHRASPYPSTPRTKRAPSPGYTRPPPVHANRADRQDFKHRAGLNYGYGAHSLHRAPALARPHTSGTLDCDVDSSPPPYSPPRVSPAPSAKAPSTAPTAHLGYPHFYALHVRRACSFGKCGGAYRAAYCQVKSEPPPVLLRCRNGTRIDANGPQEVEEWDAGTQSTR
ncbi:hypothetical protein HYPSUDRAFT_197187 [Hypholoma sublateritium FD-334 SS-4]|uniref:Uncharacterized protein n=1 Tax=Hypholoma sublateritium (strain FD-334 SS-4) TaxID=945553 RepID=A0A0D2LKM1_HYPSF|nr:hypothetical protein HYPSUDRAFT_197187 [Hypholoma sublateritium FD-334 SS-4]